jgi:hypothetical protein
VGVELDGNFPHGTASKVVFLLRTATLGSCRANWFGLHDMHANARLVSMYIRHREKHRWTRGR